MAQTNTTPETNNLADKLPRLRRFFFNEDNSNNRRRVTVVYQHDRTNKTLTYGASVYHVDLTPTEDQSTDSRSQKTEKFNKEKHYDTALKRFTEHPVVLQNFQDEEKFADFRRKVRKQLFTHGVRAHVNVA